MFLFPNLWENAVCKEENNRKSLGIENGTGRGESPSKAAHGRTMTELLGDRAEQGENNPVHQNPG